MITFHDDGIASQTIKYVRTQEIKTTVRHSFLLCRSMNHRNVWHRNRHCRPNYITELIPLGCA